MPLSLQRAIAKTIAYADIFDYPLTLNEIKRWLIGLRVGNKELPARNALLRVAGGRIKNIKNIQEQGGYYFLEGRKKLVNLRNEREKYSQEKLKIVQDIGSLLKIIPTVKLVGITGALAVENAQREDDIDLFIITSVGFLWITRLLVTLLIEITGMRRHPQEISVNNKICLNMFADENNLAIPKKEQDLFSAHEVAQMNLLWERDNTYKKFLIANQWVMRYLPNAYKELALAISDKDTSDGGEATTSTPPRWRNQKRILGIVEFLLKQFQLWYMRNRRTKEVIKEGIIRFHPHDAREWVMREYKKRIKQLK